MPNDMRSVKMLKKTSVTSLGRIVEIGEIVSIPQNVAERWVNANLAEYNYTEEITVNASGDNLTKKQVFDIAKERGVFKGGMTANQALKTIQNLEKKEA